MLTGQLTNSWQNLHKNEMACGYSVRAIIASFLRLVCVYQKFTACKRSKNMFKLRMRLFRRQAADGL